MISKWVSCLCVIACVLISCTSVHAAFDGQLLRIGDHQELGVAPYFYGDMDAAGYSDWIWYGPSPIHDYSYHEVLSGEWGAAIYYDGIDTELTVDPNDSPTKRQAMWLTKDFVFANWRTNSDFVFDDTCVAQHDYSNPTPLNNWGRSIIKNDEVQITIDYEVVDMNSISTGAPRSPMAFIKDPNTGTVSFIYSDQYVFLQTYTIKNLKSTSLNGLEFYQFLHSHGANEYEPRVNSTYTDALISDPLAAYTPYDPVHQVGNFRYDITQWNSPPYGSESYVDHVDYVGFSSTVEPNWIDNGVYDSIHDYVTDKRTYGAHVNVENRSLNDANSIYLAEVGGAMGWDMDSLDPNETTSMTIAFMFAPHQDTSALILTKTIEDANDCYSPGDEFTYTIEWENIGLYDADDAVLTDFLPAGLSYPVTYSFDPNFTVSSSDPNYSVGGENTYTWNLGAIPANSSGSVTLTVKVNEMAEPGMSLVNQAVLETSIGTATAYHTVDVCCWDFMLMPVAGQVRKSGLRKVFMIRGVRRAPLSPSRIM
jgi:fimbrial isopeptide formation D2 family protein